MACGRERLHGALAGRARPARPTARSPARPPSAAPHRAPRPPAVNRGAPTCSKRVPRARPPNLRSPVRAGLETGTRIVEEQLVETRRSPTTAGIGGPPTPRCSSGRSRTEMPWCRVAVGPCARGGSRSRRPRRSDVHTFWPVTTYSSPSRRAVVRREAEVRARIGLEKPWHQTTSPRAIGGSSARFCSSVPCRGSTARSS